jgi:hypothetical protein
VKKVKDDDIIISCDKKYTCYEHLHANECLMAYRKECKLSDKYKQALEEIRKEANRLLYEKNPIYGYNDSNYFELLAKYVLAKTKEVLNDNRD